MNKPTVAQILRSCLALVCCAGTLAPCAEAASPPPPTLRFIAPPQGYPDSFGDRLSADGTIALVNAGTLNTYAPAATGLWIDGPQGGTLTMLASPAGGSMWLGRGLGAAGDSVLVEEVDPHRSAYWNWSVSDGWTPIQELTGEFLYILPSATGGAAVAQQGTLHAVWTPGAGFTDLLSVGDSADLSGTNADGSVVVGWHDLLPSRWVRGSGWQPLVATGFTGYARALACSDDGSTVVGMGNASADEWVPRLWWWEESRGRIEWMTPHQFEPPTILALSGNGRVAVGTVARSACMITRENGLTDLNAYLAVQGVDTQGRWLIDADGVSVDGSTIVGTAWYGNAPAPLHSEAFVLRMTLCPADVGRAGGEPGADGTLDNNDLIVFIDQFFTMIAVADRGSTGAVPLPDGEFDTNDFVVFIDQFFAGC